MKPFILPIAGIGPIVIGPASQQWLEVRRGDELLTITRLPNGRCVLPPTGGILTVHNAGKVVESRAVDARLVPEFGPGPYELRANGTLHVWQFDGDRTHGLLAGGASMVHGDGYLDLASVELPHESSLLAVQVRAGRVHGPVQFVLYQPAPRPAAIAIDHDVGTLGPRTHLNIDSGGLAQLEVTVRRDIRQTGQTITAPYEITPDANRITFDDLLHGDRLSVTVEAPHALSDEGRAVRDLEYRYHAVPEPRLVRDGGGGIVTFEAGIAPVAAGETAEALRKPLGSTMQPTWHEEFPNATRGQRLETLPQVLRDVGLGEAIGRAADLRWWLGVLDAGQSLAAARRVRSLRLPCPPMAVDQVNRAVDELKEFPAHIFGELGADGAHEDLIAFQEALGIRDQPGDAVVRLAGRARHELQAAADAWVRRIRHAGLDWLDGAIPPLQDGLDITALRELILEDPGQAIQVLRSKRHDMARIARPGEDVTDPDIDARRALLAAHFATTTAILARLADQCVAAGTPSPHVEVVDLASLTRGLGDALRATEAALATVEAVPTTGPAFVAAAAEDGRRFSKELHDALGIWLAPGIAPAVRLPTQRLLDALTPEAGARLGVWYDFIEDSADLVRDVRALASTTGEVAAIATHVAMRFGDAYGNRDPVTFAEGCHEYATIETALVTARDAWQDAISGCSDATYEALDLSAGPATPWDGLRHRINADAAQIRELGQMLDGSVGERRLSLAVRTGGDLDKALEAVQQAGRDVERAEALAKYDRLRTRIAAWFGHEDAVLGLRSAYVNAIADEIRRALHQSLGAIDPHKQAALAAFSEVEGSRELLVLTRFLELAENADAASDEAAQDAERAAQLLEYVRQARFEPWGRIAEAIVVRLRAAYPDLRRYLGDAAPSWERIEHPDDALRWLSAVAAGQRDSVTGLDLATMHQGTRRLLEHTLKERGLWLA